MAVSKRLRYEVLRRDNHACRYCGGSAPDVKLTVDHVIPSSLGGSDEPDNLVAACIDCNAGKAASNPDAPLVADVQQDMLRWREAMALCAHGASADRLEREDLHLAFENGWWLLEQQIGRRAPLDPLWRVSVDRFIDLGLEYDDLDECTNLAMASRARGRDVWAYFCGVAWRMLRDRQEHAARILAWQDARAAGGTK